MAPRGGAGEWNAKLPILRPRATEGVSIGRCRLVPPTIGDATPTPSGGFPLALFGVFLGAKRDAAVGWLFGRGCEDPPKRTVGWELGKFDVEAPPKRLEEVVVGLGWELLEGLSVSIG